MILPNTMSPHIQTITICVPITPNQLKKVYFELSLKYLLKNKIHILSIYINIYNSELKFQRKYGNLRCT